MVNLGMAFGRLCRLTLGDVQQVYILNKETVLYQL